MLGCSLKWLYHSYLYSVLRLHILLGAIILLQSHLLQIGSGLCLVF